MARLSEPGPADSRPTQLFCIFDFYFFLSTYKYKGHTQVDRLSQVETDSRDLHVKALLLKIMLAQETNKDNLPVEPSMRLVVKKVWNEIV